MKDWFHKLLKVVDHNRYTLAGVLFAVLGVWALFAVNGCESRTIGIDGSAVAVSRPVLDRQIITAEKGLTLQRLQVEQAVAAFNASVEEHNARVSAAYDDLERQDEIRAQILEAVGSVAVTAATGTINPASLIPIGIGLAGLLTGAGVLGDNRRKDSIIKQIKQS